MSHVTLSGHQHALADATIGRLEALQAALVGDYASPITRSVAILNAMLVKPLDGSTPARIDDLNQAVRDAMRHAGLKEPAPGEGQAPAGA